MFFLWYKVWSFKFLTCKTEFSRQFHHDSVRVFSVSMTMVGVRIMFVTVADNAMRVMVLVRTTTHPFKIVRMLMVCIVNMAV